MPTKFASGTIEYQTYGFDLVGIFGYISGLIKTFFGYGDPFAQTTTYSDVLSFLYTLWNIYAIIALVLSALFFYGFVYAKMRLAEYGAAEDASIAAAEQAWQEKYGGATKKSSRIDDIKQHIASDNPNDWRIAIVEADIVLEDLLDKAGFPGFSIGEKLKSANPATFRTLQDAWEAHKVRNQIAHEGAGFELTHKIANETIIRYERVFQEFNI